MRLYAIENCDRWVHWHVATVAGQLCVYTEKKQAIAVVEQWKGEAVSNKMIRDSISWAGINYRVRPFNPDRLAKRRRNRPLKEK